MASKKISMYTKKSYELEELQEKINEGMNSYFFVEAEFKDATLRYLGETKTMLIVYEKWFMRTRSHASLVIMLSEFNGSQCADIISTGGKMDFFSVGTEYQLSKVGADVLRELGFEEMDE